MEKKRIKLNSLQSKTLVLLQVLARDPDSASPAGNGNEGDIRITRLPHAHGHHMHVGDYVVSSRDASGLNNKSVWTALSRKGLVRENWEQEIILTKQGLDFVTGLGDKFLTATDH
ncbi:hypothetical protein [Sneathiella litorea]|uniref:hypothetical protein n=1 Tax=Sneathiella litorea TaxID=2606216 RepID=UPI001927DEF4|nr:hypothetical protein [Sneathiella litorea]